jgi:hypothetical protein
MEVRLQIEYAELFALVSQLPAGQILQLKSDLSQQYILEKAQLDKPKLRALLLKGPLMTVEQYQLFLENRKWMNQWRKQKPFS